MRLRSLFATRILETSLAGRPGFAAFNAELVAACRTLAEEDAAGRDWCREHGYGGYTSYASINDLTSRGGVFRTLKRKLDRLALAFAAELALDLGGGRLKLDGLWVAILNPGAAHWGHVHQHSALSGTYYASMPPGAGGLEVEDPRMPLMMAAPGRLESAPEELQDYVCLQPDVGTVLMWESWLRHAVPVNRAGADRISVSFNYAWR